MTNTNTSTTTATPVATYSAGDDHAYCSPHLDGATLTLAFQDGRTEVHDLAAFTVKASIGSYAFESDQSVFELTFLDPSTGSAGSTVAVAGAVTVLGSAAAGVSAGSSAARHVNATIALRDSGYIDFYDPLKANAGAFHEPWRTRPPMLVRYALLPLTAPLFLLGGFLLLCAASAIGIMLPALMAASTVDERFAAKALLGYALILIFGGIGSIFVPISRIGFAFWPSIFAQNYWATPPQQMARIDAELGLSAGDTHRLRNLMFYNQPRWISIVTPYLALVAGLFMLVKQHNNPEINVGNDAPLMATVIVVLHILVQLAFGLKMLVESRTMQCDDAPWILANVTDENSLMTRSNLVPVLRHAVAAGLLLAGATALFSLL